MAFHGRIHLCEFSAHSHFSAKSPQYEVTSVHVSFLLIHDHLFFTLISNEGRTIAMFIMWQDSSLIFMI